MRKPLYRLFLFLLISPQISFGQSNICATAQDFKFVILGSSTSAGPGASTPDSAWVNRFKSHLQDINPNNEVVNFGVGGYNTYKIMPTGFTPPTGRPNPDPAKNITAAINEAPDAIIVNMPSNDVSANFTYSEQMDNLHTIVDLATLNNIPIWICTTQPRNFSDTNKLNLQWEIKDSIQSQFAPYTIDFWTTIALPNYTIDPLYDSGDGVHLNDFGHGVLAQKVIDKNLLDSLFVPLNYPDFATIEIIPVVSVCGDTNSLIEVVIANIGISNLNTTQVVLHSGNSQLQTTFSDTTLLQNGLSACTLDTLLFTVNTSLYGNYNVSAITSNSSDTVSSNDTLALSFSTLGHPSFSFLGDTLCDPDLAYLQSGLNSSDTVFWYDAPFSPTYIGTGPDFTTPFIDTTTIYYAQAIRGNLFYTDQLHTTINSTINFNGTIFDVIAHDDLIIDSFDVKIFSPGLQDVEVYYKSSSYQGFELIPNSWTLLGVETVEVLDPNAWTSVPIGNLQLNMGDTVGIYIQMANPNSRLSYSSVSAEQERSTPELTMISGSGIAHNFSNLYYPRDWSGGVYYHFGDRPLGDCATEREEVVAYVNEIELISGNDTIIDITDTISFTATSGMLLYDWSNGETDSTIQIIAADLGIGIHHFELITLDSLNCSHSNQFVVAVADLVGLGEEQINVSISPNPTKGLITIDSPSNSQVSFYTMDGSAIEPRRSAINQFNLANFPNGVYFVRIEMGEAIVIRKLIKSN